MLCYKLHLSKSLHYKSWWQWLAKDSCFKELLSSVSKGGMNHEYEWTFRNHTRTLEHSWSTSTHSRLYLSLFSVFWTGKKHRNASLELQCYLQHLCMHTMMPLAQKWCYLVVGHTLIYTVFKFELNWTDGFWDTAIFVSSPYFSDLTIENMASEPTSSASMPTTPFLCQAPVNVPLPTYDWNVADQMQEFHLFKFQLETWFRLLKIKAEECLHYLLCILGKDGYAAMDHWVLLDEGHKQNPEKFLDYIESTLDDKISPQVCVSELEDVKKRSDKSVNELVDRIC